MYIVKYWTIIPWIRVLYRIVQIFQCLARIYNTRTTAILITVLNWLYKPCDESEKLYLIFVSELLALDDSKLRAGTYDVPNKKNPKVVTETSFLILNFLSLINAKTTISLSKLE